MPNKWLRIAGVALAAMGPVAVFDYAETQVVNPIFLYTVAGLIGSIGIALGVRINRSPQRVAWYSIALGNLSFVAGDLLFNYLDVRGELTYPGSPDILYLAGYLLIVFGLARLLGGGRRARANIIDASIIATSAALVGWVFLMEPYASDASLSLGAKLVSIAYPMADVLLLAAALGLFLSGSRRNPSLGWLGLSLISLLVSDILYGITSLQGTYDAGWVDAGYLIGYFTLASAGLDPSMRDLSPKQREGLPTLPRRRIALLAAAALLGPGMLAISAVAGVVVDPLVVSVGTLTLFLLALLRISGLMRAIEQDASLLASQGAQLKLTLDDLRVVEKERRRLLEAVMVTAEHERAAVAAYLHDGPIQQLTTLGYELELAIIELEGGDPQGCGRRLSEVRRDFSTQIYALRNLMTDLRPPVLDERGVVAALRDQAAAFASNNGITCEVDVDPIRLDRTLETILYRAAQECLANVAEHSQATRVDVQLRRTQDEIVLEISDDGIGVTAARRERAVKEGHLGLVSMKERVELAGGMWELDSSSDRGTLIRVRFPIGALSGGKVAAEADAR